MPEIDEAADAIPGSEETQELPAQEGSLPLIGDDLDLEVIEGLAEEDHVHSAPILWSPTPPVSPCSSPCKSQRLPAAKRT